MNPYQYGYTIGSLVKQANVMDDVKDLDLEALKRRALYDPSQSGLSPALLSMIDPILGGVAGGWHEAHPWKRGLSTFAGSTLGGGTLGLLASRLAPYNVRPLAGLLASIAGRGVGGYGGYKLSE